MCHPEPGPVLDSGSENFRVSYIPEARLPVPGDAGPILKRVQHKVQNDVSRGWPANSGFYRRHGLPVALLYAHLVLRVFRGRSWDVPRLH